MTALLPLMLFVLASTFSPGGATTLATVSGARFGVARSLPLILGIALALMLMATLAALGLGQLIVERPQLKFALQVIGTVYLLWLAFTLLRSGAPSSRAELAQPLSMGKAMLLLASNPKSWAMTVSAAATFAPLACSAASLAALLALAFGLAGWFSLTLWCWLGRLLAKMLSTPRHWRCFNVVMATLLAASILPTWI